MPEHEDRTLGSIRMSFFFFFFSFPAKQVHSFGFNQYNLIQLKFLTNFYVRRGPHLCVTYHMAYIWSYKWHVCLMAEVLLLLPSKEGAKSRNLAELLNAFKLHSGPLSTQLYFEHLWGTLRIASQVGKLVLCLYCIWKDLNTHCHLNPTLIFWFFREYLCWLGMP